jgi:hypothetical protein
MFTTTDDTATEDNDIFLDLALLRDLRVFVMRSCLKYFKAIAQTLNSNSSSSRRLSVPS